MYFCITADVAELMRSIHKPYSSLQTVVCMGTAVKHSFNDIDEVKTNSDEEKTRFRLIFLNPQFKHKSCTYLHSKYIIKSLIF